MTTENVTSTAPAELAGAGDLLALASSTDAKLTAPVPGSPEALALEQQAAAAPKIPLEQELAGMFAMIGAGAGHWLPSVGRVLDEQACKALGDSLAPIAHKYGLARYLEGFGWRVELQALMVVVPIGFALRDAVRADLAELKRRQAEAEGRAPSSPAAQPGVTQSDAMQPEVTSPPPPAPIGMLQPTAGYIPQ